MTTYQALPQLMPLSSGNELSSVRARTSVAVTPPDEYTLTETAPDVDADTRPLTLGTKWYQTVLPSMSRPDGRTSDSFACVVAPVVSPVALAIGPPPL